MKYLWNFIILRSKRQTETRNSYHQRKKHFSFGPRRITAIKAVLVPLLAPPLKEIHYSSAQRSWRNLEFVVQIKGWRMVPGKLIVSENFVPISKSRRRFQWVSKSGFLVFLWVSDSQIFGCEVSESQILFFGPRFRSKPWENCLFD